MDLYSAFNGDPVNVVDPTGRYAVLDDLIFAGVGAAFGLGATLVTDAVSVARGGEMSSWTTYLGNTTGSALGGLTTLYAGPIFGGGVGGMTSNAITQNLDHYVYG